MNTHAADAASLRDQWLKLVSVGVETANATDENVGDEQVAVRVDDGSFGGGEPSAI